MTEPVRSYIGRRIKQARLEKRWSLREMAQQYGTSHSAIRDYERGETRIDVANLEKFSEVLEKPIAWFIPGWWDSDETISPDLIKICRRIDELPSGQTRDKLVRMIRETIDLLEKTVELEAEARDRIR